MILEMCANFSTQRKITHYFLKITREYLQSCNLINSIILFVLWLVMGFIAANLFIVFLGFTRRKQNYIEKFNFGLARTYVIFIKYFFSVVVKWFGTLQFSEHLLNYSCFSNLKKNYYFSRKMFFFFSYNLE